MKPGLKYAISAAAVVLAVSACDNSPKDEYTEPEFKPYVERFFEYARQYGLGHVEDYGLHIEFADLTDGRAGQCFMGSRPVHIQIDRDYWYNSIAGIGNSEDVREDLIFHEMGHGFLDRGHTNGVLENNDWQSMMCGDELPHGRASNINYRGFRKEYYINELFNAPVDKPAWSTYVPDFTDLREQTVIRAYGDGNEGWYMPASPFSDIETKIENGSYVVSNLSTLPYIVPVGGKRDLPDIADGAYFEAKMRASGLNGDFAGIAVGKYGNDINMYFLRYDTEGMCIVGETSCSPFLEIYDERFSSETNVLGIRTRSDTVYLYHNGEFLYHFEMGTLTHTGDVFGLVVPPLSTVYVDYAEIRSEAAALRSAEEKPSRQAAPFTFEEKSLPSLYSR